MKRAIAFVFLLSVSTALVAADAPRLKADTRDTFASVAASVRTDMAEDGRYSYLKPDEREKVEVGLATMQELFARHATVAEMDKATKVDLFNVQESVNALLTLRDRDRLICERGASVGSRIVSTSCRTYGQIEAARQASAKFMQERATTPCNAPSCTGR